MVDQQTEKARYQQKAPIHQDLRILEEQRMKPWCSTFFKVFERWISPRKLFRTMVYKRARFWTEEMLAWRGQWRRFMKLELMEALVWLLQKKLKRTLLFHSLCVDILFLKNVYFFFCFVFYK
jgi:hypothetical protein